MHVNTLIELAIQKTDRKSLRSLAERMEVSSSKVSEWKTGQAPIPEVRIAQLARLIGQDPGPWMLLIKSEQTEGEVAREWAKLAKRLATSAIAVFLMFGSATSFSKKAYASEAYTTALRIDCILCK